MREWSTSIAFYNLRRQGHHPTFLRRASQALCGCIRRTYRSVLRRLATLDLYSQSDLNKVALRLNQRPRQTLGFQPPASKTSGKGFLPDSKLSARRVRPRKPPRWDRVSADRGGLRRGRVCASAGAKVLRDAPLLSRR